VGAASTATLITASGKTFDVPAALLAAMLQ